MSSSVRPIIHPADRAKADLSAHAPSRTRFHFMDDVAIEKLPPPSWQVDDLIPASGLSIIYAPPESAKTFFTFSLGFSIATGRPFFGRAVRRGPVVYVAAEGSSGLPVRVAAWKHSQEWYELAGVHFLTEPVQLLEMADVGTFLAALDSLPKPPVAIVFDTLHRCMAGGDENSARDMGMAIQAIDHIRRATKAAVVVVHHTRKDGDSERGSTSLRGAADSMISLRREDDRITVSCEKQKDAAHFSPFTLELIQVQESCVLITAGTSSAVMRMMPGDPKHQALSILQSSSLDDGLSTTAWKEVSGMKERTFYEARKWLVANGYVDGGRKRRDPNIVTSAGTYAITANCNLTADDTAAQYAAITASTSPSLGGCSNAVTQRERGP